MILKISFQPETLPLPFLMFQWNLDDVLQGGHINILRKYNTCTADSNFRTFITEDGFPLPVLIFFFFQVVSPLDYTELGGDFLLLHISFLRACPLLGMAGGPEKGRIRSPWLLWVCPLTGEMKPGATGGHTESTKWIAETRSRCQGSSHTVVKSI